MNVYLTSIGANALFEVTAELGLRPSQQASVRHDNKTESKRQSSSDWMPSVRPDCKHAYDGRWGAEYDVPLDSVYILNYPIIRLLKTAPTSPVYTLP